MSIHKQKPKVKIQRVTPKEIQQKALFAQASSKLYTVENVPVTGKEYAQLYSKE